MYISTTKKTHIYFNLKVAYNLTKGKRNDEIHDATMYACLQLYIIAWFKGVHVAQTKLPQKIELKA